MRNLLSTWADLSKAHGMQPIEDYLKKRRLI